MDFLQRKEQLMVTLRQELGITDAEHLEIVMGMDSNNAPSQLRSVAFGYLGSLAIVMIFINMVFNLYCMCWSERERDEYRGPMYVPHGESFPAATMPVSRKRQKSTYMSQASPGPSMMKSALSPSSLALTNAGKGAPSVGGSRRHNSRGV